MSEVRKPGTPGGQLKVLTGPIGCVGRNETDVSEHTIHVSHNVQGRHARNKHITKDN